MVLLDSIVQNAGKRVQWQSTKRKNTTSEDLLKKIPKLAGHFKAAEPSLST